MLYFIRIIFILIFVFLGGLVGILISLCRPFNPSNIFVVAKFFRFGLNLLGVKVIVRNEELLHLNSPQVIVSNHQENMDVFIGARMIPDKTVTIGKRSIIFIPFFGLFYWLSGNILINRKNKKSAVETMDQAAQIIIKNKTSIWVLAEGTRSKGRGVLPFKKGAFFTAIKAQVPITPVVISSYKNLNFNRLKTGTVIVEVLPSVSSINKVSSDVDQFKNEIQLLVKNKVAELDRELNS